MSYVVKPIRNEADLLQAEATIEALWGVAEGTPEFDTACVLITLVDAYQQKQASVPMPDPIDVIKFRMEQMGLSRKDLEPAIGTRSRVSEILNGKRHLTLEMIRQLRSLLHIPAGLLLV